MAASRAASSGTRKPFAARTWLQQSLSPVQASSSSAQPASVASLGLHGLGPD